MNKSHDNSASATPNDDDDNNNNNNNNEDLPTRMNLIRASFVIPARRKMEKTILPQDYEPSKFSVICGRGKGSYQSDGNVNFRALVKSNLERYKEAPGRLEKSFIVSEVLNMIRESCPVGAFVKYENGRWYDLDDTVCREKVGSLFRDFLHTEYKSSSKAKHAKRVAENSPTKRRRSSNSTATSSGPDDGNGDDADDKGGTEDNTPTATAAVQAQTTPSPVKATAKANLDSSPPPVPGTSLTVTATTAATAASKPTIAPNSYAAPCRPAPPQQHHQLLLSPHQLNEEDGPGNFYDIDDLSLRKLE